MNSRHRLLTLPLISFPETLFVANKSISSLRISPITAFINAPSLPTLVCPPFKVSNTCWCICSNRPLWATRLTIFSMLSILSTSTTARVLTLLLLCFSPFTLNQKSALSYSGDIHLHTTPSPTPFTPNFLATGHSSSTADVISFRLFCIALVLFD